MKPFIALIAAFSLAACATAGNGPVSIVKSTSNTTGTHVAVMLPLGNESLDNGGMDYIAGLAAQVPGVTRVQIYDYYQTQIAADAISADPSNVKEVVIGFSCGANASPVVGAGTNHRVDGIAVIQVSEWCGGLALTGNVMRAQETYNPNCLDTGGLGCGKLVPGPSFNPANLTFIERPDCHICSDHDPDAQNDVISVVRAVAATSSSRKLVRAFGPPRYLVRYHGQTVN